MAVHKAGLSELKMPNVKESEVEKYSIPAGSTPSAAPAANPPQTTQKKGLAELNQMGVNPFEDYGNQASQQNIRGQLLKFSKGDWLAGRDENEIPAGTKFVANMDQLLLGWVKWVDNKPEQQIMGLLVERHQPKKRDELGDLDETLWPLDSTGKARDPWQFTNYMIMKMPEVDGTKDDNLFTFTTSSRGGLGCIGDLCKAYGKVMAQKEGEYPIVEIGSGSYPHPNPEFGRIKFPKMTVVGWEKKSYFGEEAKAPY